MKIYMAKKGKVLELYEANGDFDKCVEELKAEGLELITAKELAEARMIGGTNSFACKNWSWIAENFNYLPNGDILFASKEFSPLLNYPSLANQATDCHRQHREFYLNDEAVESLLEGTKQKGGVLYLKRKDVPLYIPSSAFGKEAVTAFLFGDEAGNYGHFLNENKVKNVQLCVAGKEPQKKGKAFSCSLWIEGFNDYSTLYGCGGFSLLHSGRAFGMRRL